MIVGTAGHIDHGKTALVRALTGVDTDRLPEEKRRGITIDLGFAPLRDGDEVVAGIVDVPGHEAFVRTMIAGASGIDLALLVVAADEGVMPQTREHLAILGLLGTQGGVIALSKSDLVDREWLDLVRAEVVEVVRATPLAEAPIVAVSASTGDGVGELRAALVSAVRALPARRDADVFRMPIDRVFSVRGTGTVVTGTVWSGRVRDGETLLLLPLGRAVRVRGVQSHGQAVEAAGSGTRTAVALAGVDVADAHRGAWLVGSATWPASRVLRADVALLPGAVPLRPREWIRLHLGTSDVAARVVGAGGPLVPGERRAVRIMLAEPLASRALDRFVLRRASPVATVGGGTIVDPLPARRRPRPWPVGLVEPADRLRRMLDEAGWLGVPESVLPHRLGLPPDATRALSRSTGDAVRIGERLFGESFVRRAVEEIDQAVSRFHAGNPLEPYMPLSALRSGAALDQVLVAHALETLTEAGRLEVEGAHVRRRGWSPGPSEGQATLRQSLLEEVSAGGSEPPDVAALERAHSSSGDVRALLRLLEREGLVIAVETERYYEAEAVRRLVARLRAGMTNGTEYSPTELREVLGLSRKYLIPFLEFCDRKRITERRATGRVLLDS